MATKTDITLSTCVYDEESREYEMATPLVVDGELTRRSTKTSTLDDDDKCAALANGVTWTDRYFDDEDFDDDIIAVFDFDYESMETFYTSMGWATLASSVLAPPIFVTNLLGCGPCFLRKNVEWTTRTRHVAITQDGIRFVRARRPYCWGLGMCDQGKSSKTVPFDKITDCDIEEPAGNSCFCVPNILTVVNVDTASSGAEGEKELVLSGLKDPHTFKKLVWAMKRSQQQARGAAPTTANAVMADRGNNNSDEMAGLLREIRDELRVNNGLLKTQIQPPPEQLEIL